MIREDRASVYHWDYNGKNYAVQFGLNDLGRFYIQEIKGRFNEACTSEGMRELIYRLTILQSI